MGWAGKAHLGANESITEDAAQGQVDSIRKLDLISLAEQRRNYNLEA